MAGRIPQHFIDQLINRVDLVDLIDGYVPLKKAGSNYKACCPFHNEKTPSFSVSEAKQFYHCFGCGASGTAISFLMEYDHLEFREAVEKLAGAAGLEIPEEAQTAQPVKHTQQGIDLYELMKSVSAYFQEQLRHHSDRGLAVDYLKNRGLSGQTAKHFGLGYAPEGWDNLMSKLGTSSAQKKALEDTGMLTRNEKGRVYDRFRGRIMFPIEDHRGRIVGFGGRVLDKGEPKYLNSPETPIFHKGSELYGLYGARGGIKEQDNVIVVEGYMDVVALAEAGVNNAVATLGTATTTMHLQRLFRHTSNLVFSFDGDRAGRAAAWKALETSLPQMQDGRTVSFLFLPDGEDPDSMVQKEDKEAFLERVKTAKPIIEFLIAHLSEQADLDRLDGRAKLASLAKPLIKQLPKGVLRQLFIETIARMVNTAPNSLLEPEPARQESSRPGKRLHKSSKPAPLTPMRRAISLLLQHPELAHNIKDLGPLRVSQVHGKDVLVDLLELCKSGDGISTGVILERFREQGLYSALEKLASHDHLLESEALQSTFQSLIAGIEQSAASSELDTLIAKAENQSLNSEEKLRLNQLLQR